MIIVVDCNNDTITIDEVEMVCKHPVKTIGILQEIFNRIPSLSNVEIQKIDEDTHVTVDEW
jgi:hypothetical protein